MATCEKFFSLQIESLLMSDIVLSSPALLDGKFIPGASIEQKTVSVSLTSDVAFPCNVVLRLKLVASIDEAGVKTNLSTPICVEKRITNDNKTVWFDFVGAQIPLPKGYVYLPNAIEDCSVSPRLQAGGVQKYYFLLSTKKCKTSPLTCPGMPFIARVLSGANCDIKCEKPEIVSEQDESHPLKIYCNDTKTFVYSSQPHCVTHCQAPRPLFLFYTIGANTPSALIVHGQPCTTCQ